MRTLLLSLVLCGACLAQTCNLTLAATTAPATSAWYDNRVTLCRTFVVTYQASGFSALSFELDGAPCATTSCNSQGTAVPIPSPIQGSNPSTDTGQETLVTNLYYPWIRLNLSAVTGTGTFSATALGYPGLSARTQSIVPVPPTPFSLTPASSPTIGYLTVVKLVPVNPTVTPTCVPARGDTCNNTWGYNAVVCLGDGHCENTGTISTNAGYVGGNPLNLITISVPLQPYATTCYLYRTVNPIGLTDGIIATVSCAGATVIDNRLVGDGSFPPASSTGGITAASIDGHITNRNTGPHPSINPGDCGTVPTVGGTDVIGNVTFGTGGTTVCTITFGTVWIASGVSCFVNPTNLTAQVFVSSENTTNFTITANAPIDGEIVNWICLGIR